MHHPGSLARPGHHGPLRGRPEPPTAADRRTVGSESTTAANPYRARRRSPPDERAEYEFVWHVIEDKSIPIREWQ